MHDHFAALIVRRKNPDTGATEHLVLDSTPVDDSEQENAEETKDESQDVQTKYPGGRKREKTQTDPVGMAEETPLQTAIRELFEEVGLRVTNKKKIRLVRVILSMNHCKYWFLVDDFYTKGEPKLSGKPDTRAMHSNLRYEPVNTLYDKLYRTHRDAFLDSVKEPPISLPFG